MATTNTDEKPAVVLYTDGSCQGNPGPGGWGVYMHNGTKAKELCGGERDTTNNRMELLAVIKALEFFKTPRRLTVHADSRYVIDGATKWMPKWVAKGWLGSDGKPVKNRDLWERLQAEAARHEVSWVWVKGHAGNAGNERADALASLAAVQAQAVPTAN